MKLLGQIDRHYIGAPGCEDGFLCCHVAQPQLKDVGIDDKLVRDNERMLTGGFYAEVDLSYDAVIAQEKMVEPFLVSSLSTNSTVQT